MREPKPFFRAQTQPWYLCLDKKFIPLRKDETEASEEYHRIMNKRRHETIRDNDSVAKLLDLCWQWCLGHLAASMGARRQPILKSFGEHLGARFSVRRLRPYHVQEWIDQMFSVPKRHSDTYRHNLITIIKGAVEWAAKMGYIDHSPIAKLMKPTPAVRQDFVTAVRWPDVLAVTTDQPLKDFRVAQLPPLPAVALRR